MRFAIQSFYNNYLFLNLSNIYNLFNDIFTYFTLTFFSMWKVANYADAYWFLYSTKKITYEVIHQINQK